VYHDADNLDTAFDAGGKVSIGLTATTIVSQWTWSATLLQSSTVASKVIFYCNADGRSENLWVRGAQGVISPFNTFYLTNSYIVFILKMEFVPRITIFSLKMIVKSGLENMFLK
jgi:hypothetical protein